MIDVSNSKKANPPFHFCLNWLAPELVSNIECDCQKINELFLVPFLRLHIFWDFFFSFPYGIDLHCWVSECKCWLWCNVEKLLFSAL